MHSPAILTLCASRRTIGPDTRRVPRVAPPPAAAERDPARRDHSQQPAARRPTDGGASIMHARVRYPDSIEPLVQFIEQTPPAEIVDRTLEKLRAGLDAHTMLTASALAVTRSSDLPPGHHGGPLHPLAGMHAIFNLV